MCSILGIVCYIRPVSGQLLRLCYIKLLILMRALIELVDKIKNQVSHKLLPCLTHSSINQQHAWYFNDMSKKNSEFLCLYFLHYNLRVELDV